MALGVLGTAYQQTFVNQAIQIVNITDFSSYELSGLCKAPSYLQLSLRRKRNLKSKSLIFAISNESNEAERIGSKTSTDDQLFISPEYNEICDDSQYVKVVASTSHSEGEVSQRVDEHLKKQGTLLDKLKAVQLHVLASEQWNASRLKLCHRRYTVSATNLIHHLALTSLDVEQLKDDLSSVGLLNLETINPYVLASLTAGIQMLENFKSNSFNINQNMITQKHPKTGEYIINSMKKNASSHKDLLLGSLQNQRSTHIMATVGEEAIESDNFISDLIKTGTTIIRINCAHGTPSIWSEIIKRVKTSSQLLEKPCRVLMDLAGPKLRTEKLKPGARVMKISPKKNETGNIISPAQVWLSHKGAGPPPAHLSPDAVIFIDGQEFLSKLQVGDTVRFSDARGKKKTINIFNKCHVFGGSGFMAECARTAYIQSGTILQMKGKKGKFAVGHVVDVPPVDQCVRLRIGDLLIISRDSLDDKLHYDGAHRVACNSSYLFDSVKPGDPIAFDDGKIWGVIQGNSTSEIIVSITHASPKGTKLGSEKSINVPESNILFEGLTSKDLMDLDFVSSHADMVGISFLRDTRDITVLFQELDKRKLHKIGIVLKIETKSGFEKLPMMLLEAMKSSNPLGVMIARGDLAVECGWEKLADMQEEILAICAAAHIPVIWATQVLESLVKSGVPSRAEITDVACGKRSSCIMLNKGKHILKAVSMLDTILRNDNSAKTKTEQKPLLLTSRLF